MSIILTCGGDNFKRRFSCILLKFVGLLHAANNQFSDKFNDGGGLLSSMLFFQMIFTLKRLLEAEALLMII